MMELASRNVWELTSAQQIEPLRFSPEGDRILVWMAGRNEAGRNDMSLPSVSVDSSDAQRPLSVYTHHSDARLLVTGTSWGDWQWQPNGS
jgi:hypothetical protein